MNCLFWMAANTIESRKHVFVKYRNVFNNTCHGDLFHSYSLLLCTADWIRTVRLSFSLSRPVFAPGKQKLGSTGTRWRGVYLRRTRICIALSNVTGDCPNIYKITCTSRIIVVKWSDLYIIKLQHWNIRAWRTIVSWIPTFLGCWKPCSANLSNNG